MIELPTIYNRNNILLAIAENGDIAGALVGCNCPFEEEKKIYSKHLNRQV